VGRPAAHEADVIRVPQLHRRAGLAPQRWRPREVRAGKKGRDTAWVRKRMLAELTSRLDLAITVDTKDRERSAPRATAYAKARSYRRRPASHRNGSGRSARTRVWGAAKFYRRGVLNLTQCGGALGPNARVAMAPAPSRRGLWVTDSPQDVGRAGGVGPVCSSAAKTPMLPRRE
jgi:hypothetical protein